MSWLFAMGYDRFMRRTEVACLGEWRRDLLRGLKGDVLEIGAGTGANLAHYPVAVERLVLTDPDPRMLTRLRARGGRANAAEVITASSDTLPFEDASFDAVVSTLVLCSVADVRRTLSEIGRVLRPNGQLVFLEHVAAEDDRSRFVWQRRVEPLWRLAAGNCHLTRRTSKAIEEAGFTFDAMTEESMRKAFPLVRPTIRGIARRKQESG